MSETANRLELLKKSIVEENGTVLDNVEGQVELADVDEKGELRKGPVLVLRSIEAGSQLKLAHPRAVTVLGSVSGQVFGAYRVKVGNLLSGRLEGTRHVEIIHNLGSIEGTNEDAWMVFEATSDPGFFDQARHGLDRLRELERHQKPQRESRARKVLLSAVGDFSFRPEIMVNVNGERKLALSIDPSIRDREVQINARMLLRHVLSNVEHKSSVDHVAEVKGFLKALNKAVEDALEAAGQKGLGASLRKTKGPEAFKPFVEAIVEYVEPKLMKAWLQVSQHFVQQLVDRLSAAPMVLEVGGQLAPFFQIEYPRWRFHVTGSKIVPEKVADCNIATQLGSDKSVMSVTYNYITDDDFISQTAEIGLAETKDCKLILKNGSVFLNDESRCIFGPELEKSKTKEEEAV